MSVEIEKEIRCLMGKVELRAAEGEAKSLGLRGYAAVFNQESEDFGGWRERIAPGAFNADLEAKADVRALINHNSGQILGRTKSGTLRLFEDEQGLGYELELPDTQDARDLLVKVERGDIDQMSFGFRTRKDNWETRDGYELRTLLDVQLQEISIVTFPAYPQTSASKRSLEEFLNQKSATQGPSVSNLRRRLALKAK